MGGENPCNICHDRKEFCDGDDCIFFWQRNTKAYVCEAYDCFVNYEGSCLLSLYDDCGCRKMHDGGKK